MRRANRNPFRLKAKAPVVGLLLSAMLCAAAIAEDALREGNSFLREGRLADAQRAFSRFLSARPDDARVEQVALRVAEIEYELRRDGAARGFREWLRRYGYADADGRGRYGLAESLYASGDIESSRLALLDLLGGDARPGSPFRPLAEVRLAWIRHRQGDLREATARFGRVSALFAGSPIGLRARVGLAVCAFAQGRFSRALDLCEGLAQEDLPAPLASIANAARAFSAARLAVESPGQSSLEFLDTPLARIEALRLAADNGDADTALAILNAIPVDAELSDDALVALRLAGKALAANDAPPKAIVARLAIAEHHFAESEFAEGLDAFSAIAAAEDSPFAAFACLRAGQCAEALGRIEQAGRFFERSLALFEPDAPLSALALAGAARISLGAGRVEEALEATQRLAQRFPATAQRPGVALIGAVALAARGESRQADYALNEIAAQAPEHGDIYRTAALWRARALADLGRHEESAAEYRAFLSTAENADSVRLELMDALVRSGASIDDVVDILASLIDAERETRSSALFMVARAHENAKRYGEAADRYAEAQQLTLLEETKARCRLKAAECLWRAGDIDRSLALLEAAVATNSTEFSRETLMWAAGRSRKQGRPDRAIVFLSALLEQDAADEDALGLMTRCLAEEARWEECIEFAQRLAEESPESPHAEAAALDLAEALIRTGKPTAARDALARFGDSPIVRLAWLRGEALLAEEQFEQASAAYRAPLEAHRGSLDASWKFRLLKGLAQALLGGGDQDGGIRAMREAVASRPEEPALEVERVRLRAALERLTSPR